MKNNTEKKEQQKIGTFMIAVMWVLLIIILVYVFGKVIDRQLNPNQSLSTRYAEDNAREIVLQRNHYGHYVSSGRINGFDVVFMLDTGATGVAIPEHLAKKMGLKRGRSIEMHTANGRVTGYVTELERIGIDEIELENIRAIINPGDKSDVILLGMTFLKHVEFTQRGDTLILRQYVEGS